MHFRSALVDGVPPAPSFKLKDNLKIFDRNFSMCDNSVHSFCNLTIFPGRKSEMMSTCKGRALEEGGMINSSIAKS